MSSFWLAYGLATGSAEILAASICGGLPLLVWLLAMLEPSDLRRGLGRAAPPSWP